MEKEHEPWEFYIIYNDNCGATYAGVSPDPVQRLRKHNGEISGGAKYTTGKGPGWKHVCIVSGFQTKNQALMFEWAVKHVAPRNAGGLKNRIKKLYTVLNKKNWTSKSPDSSTVPLCVEWKMDIDFSGIERFVPEYIIDNNIK
jgi:predicted GIY-YIG superfamily endonuclease